jgi:GntR family transcriptional regulator
MVHYSSNEPRNPASPDDTDAPLHHPGGQLIVFDDASPIYLQIAGMIEGEILSGALQENEQVMSTNQYAAFHRVNPATAAKGFQQLTDEGILYKKRGIGMFVSPGARQKLLERRRARFFDEVVGPMVEEARIIGIPIDQIVRHIESHQEPA